MNIGDAAAASGLPAKTIRYYEDVGLIPKPARRDSGYRDYGERDVHVLRFIARARGLGFTMDECRQLLALYRDRERASSDVKHLTEERIAMIDDKIAQLQVLRGALSHLAACCHGDDRPDCPILDDLARGSLS